MAKFRKVDDLYGRFIDYEDLTDIPIATVDENGNTIVMTKAEYEEKLRAEEEEAVEEAGAVEETAIKEEAEE